MNFRLILFLLALMILPLSSVRAESARITPVVNVIREWAPSVVNISTERVLLLRRMPFPFPNGSPLNNFPDQFQTTIGQLKLNSIGSGVIVSSEGLIITNAHVVQMASKIYVTLSDGGAVEARLIGTNPQDDLALLQIVSSHPLKAVKFASDVIIGETVITIGNPMGLQNSVSAGVVSGINRTFTSPNQAFTNLIQTDASINPGSSGGALLNLDGELTGINLAVLQNAQNISFAIPVAKVKKILEEYENYKKTHP